MEEQQTQDKDKDTGQKNYVGMWGFMLNETWQPYHSANYVTSHSLSSILLDKSKTP